MGHFHDISNAVKVYKGMNDSQVSHQPFLLPKSRETSWVLSDENCCFLICNWIIWIKKSLGLSSNPHNTSLKFQPPWSFSSYGCKMERILNFVPSCFLPEQWLYSVLNQLNQLWLLTMCGASGWLLKHKGDSCKCGPDPHDVYKTYFKKKSFLFCVGV